MADGRTTLYLAGAAVGLLLLTGGGAMLVKRATRGKRLTNAPADANGDVRRSPEELAAEASVTLGRPVDVETYALARMLASEGSSDSAQIRRMRAWVAYNDARALGGWSFVKLFTYSTRTEKRGLFGSQTTRRYSSARDPYAGDYDDALALRSEFRTGADPTGGATKYVDKSAFGTAHTSNTFAGIVERWGKDGYVPQDVDGDFVLFRRVA